jgi:hypothetical protein
MPLASCPECSQQISQTASSCPHCGYQPRPVISVGRLIFLWFACTAFALIPGGLIWSVSGGFGGDLGAVVCIVGLGLLMLVVVIRLQGAAVR